MRITKENKSWIADAIYMGSNGFEIYRDSFGPSLNEFFTNEKLEDQCVFYQKYVEFGGIEGQDYDYDLLHKTERNYQGDLRTVYEITFQYAENKIRDAFEEIDRRFKLLE
jgi:hypothetical protein